jgi:hypothetical protein
MKRLVFLFLFNMLIYDAVEVEASSFSINSSGQSLPILPFYQSIVLSF